jgi:hypothetical protein|tara:strand:+ start:8 stop:1042 length:1035 start_codon:yes stop_codon:yes gene_type:complete
VNKLFFSFFVLLIFLTISPVKSNDNINKLKILLENGLITESEFKKTLELDDDRAAGIDIKQITGKTGREKFEKYEFYIDNFRVHTLGPGTIRIDNMLTGETDVTLTGNFNVKLTNNGQNFFEFQFDEQNLKSNLLYKGRMLINWTGKYVSRYQATFHQMQVLGYQPFHYFIVIPGKNYISLNFKLFDKIIKKAVDKVKKEMALKYNLSIEDIDKIMNKRNELVNNEVEKVISKEKQKIIEELTNKYAGQEITDAIRQEIEKTIGEEMSNAVISEIERVTGQAIDSAVERELAAAINEAISYAIQQGVSEAAAKAAIEAMIWVYANGGSDEDAMEACRAHAGDAC